MEALIEKIKELSAHKSPLIIAIEGRCASGKSTLAAGLKETLGCNVIPMDHFFLQPHMRTRERLETPGGNIDYERFLQEVLRPLSMGEAVSYRPYNCSDGQLDAPITLMPARINLVEGSYSCHPALCQYYDYRIFLSTSYEEQLRRIELRNGKEGLVTFREKWIPLEEKYFRELQIEKQCDITIITKRQNAPQTD